MVSFGGCIGTRTKGGRPKCEGSLLDKKKPASHVDWTFRLLDQSRAAGEMVWMWGVVERARARGPDDVMCVCPYVTGSTMRAQGGKRR
jgi:hypothetical protein